MHPGPMIAASRSQREVAELPASLVTEQVTNGVAVRMAVLFYCSVRDPSRGLTVAERPIGRHRHAPGRARSAGWTVIDDGRAAGRRAWSSADRWPRSGAARPPPGGDGARRRGCVVAPGPRRPPHPPAPARARGRRDGRDRRPGRRARRLHGRRVHAQHRAAPGQRRGRSATVLDAGRRRHVPRWRWPVPSPWAVPASSSPPWGSSPSSGVRLFTDDGDGVQAAGHASGPRVRPRPRRRPWPSTARTTRSPAAGTCTKASGRAGSDPGHARGGRGGRWWPVTSRWRGHRRPRCTSSTCRRRGSVELVRRGEGRGVGGHRRGDAAPPRAHRRRAGRLRPRVQGEPAAATDVGRRRRSAPALADGTIDAIATDHAPHAPETQGPALRRRPAGDAGLQTALVVALTELGTVSSLQPNLGPASRGSRRRSPASTPARRHQGGPIEPGAPANLCVIDPDATWVVDAAPWPAGAATRPRAGASSPARSATPLPGRARRHRRRGPAMTRAGSDAVSDGSTGTRPLLVLADGDGVRG